MEIRRIVVFVRLLLLALGFVLVLSWASCSWADDAGATPPPKPPPAKTPAPAKKLTGAELYSMHCNRCHPERYPTERTAAQWKTILMHMRVRANLPAEQARTILKYLQDNSGR